MTLRRYIIARALRRAIKAHKTTLTTRKRQRVVWGAIADNYESGLSAGRALLAPEPVAKRKPGRQPVHFPRTDTMGLLGLSIEPEWTTLPKDARQAPWEALHTFPKDARPKRDPYFGLMNAGAALSLICPACDLEQPPLTQGERTCPYCGLKLTLKGSHVFWWRDPLHVEAWKP